MRPWILTAAGAVIGAAAGWAWWYFYGCTDGCVITSSPLNSTLYGALMGGLLVHSFRKPVSARAENTK